MRNIVRMLLWMSSLIRASVIELSMMKTDILKRSYMAEIMVYPNTINMGSMESMCMSLHGYRVKSIRAK